MGRGKRYDEEQKLNFKKVFAVVVVVTIIVLFVIGIKNLLKKDENVTNYFTEISYYSTYQNGKWGVVNSKGETVIEPEYGEMIIIPDSRRDVFVCTYEVNYADNTYKTKAINSNNAGLYTSYSSVEVLSNCDSRGNVWNEDNVLKVEKDGKYGLINLDGTEILGCSYNKIEAIKGIKNSILIQKDNLYGLVNNQGNVLIECNYIDITALTSDYIDGYIVKNSESKYGVININKEQVLECKYDEIKHVYGNDMFVVKEGDKWLIINKSGDKTQEINYEDINYINAEVIVAKLSGNYGIFGYDKTEKVKAEYQNIEYAFSDSFIAKKNEKYGVINSKGETLVPFEYDSLIFRKDADCLFGKKSEDENTYLIDRNYQLRATGKNITIHDGYIRANIDNDYKFYNLKFEEKSNRDVFQNNTLYVAKNDGKYGLVNKDGTLVVQYLYEDITEQNKYGYVAVKSDGKWGVIDQYGNTVVEPKYQFSDISNIIFVGKWHSVENVNQTYLVDE